jgi:hypothetical protein
MIIYNRRKAMAIAGISEFETKPARGKVVGDFKKIVVY